MRLVRMLVLFGLPTVVSRHVANLLGYDIAQRARIGFSLIFVDRLSMASDARIGHFNFVNGRYLLRLETGSGLGHMNLLSGSYAEGEEPVVLSLGEGTKITALHTVDVTNSISIGKFSTIAGHGTQLWTHGYVHKNEGSGRYRVDGPIDIGDNVNIGSGSIISAGVRLADGVMVGTGTAVAKSLLEPGFYVSSPLRVLPFPADPESRTDLRRVPSRSGDIVYAKSRDDPG